MNDNQSIILLKLCRELKVSIDLETDEQVAFNPEVMKHEIYKFHLGATEDQTEEALTQICESLRNQVLVFVLGIKQKTNPGGELIKATTKEYLSKFISSVSKLIEDTASNMDQLTKVRNVGKTCEIIDSSNNLPSEVNVSNSQKHIAAQILKKLEMLESAQEDLQEEESEHSDEFLSQNKQYIQDQISFWKEVAEKCTNNTLNKERTTELLQKVSVVCDEVDYLVASVRNS